MQSKIKSNGTNSGGTLTPKFTPGRKKKSAFTGALPGHNESMLFSESSDIVNSDRGFSVLGTTPDAFLTLMSQHVSEDNFRQDMAEDIFSALCEESYKVPKAHRKAVKRIRNDYVEKAEALQKAGQLALDVFLSNSNADSIPDDQELLNWLVRNNHNTLANEFILANEAELIAFQGFLTLCSHVEITKHYLKKLTKEDSEINVGHKSAMLFARHAGFHLYIWQQTGEDNRLQIVDYHTAVNPDSRAVHILTDDDMSYTHLQVDAVQEAVTSTEALASSQSTETPTSSSSTSKHHTFPYPESPPPPDGKDGPKNVRRRLIFPTSPKLTDDNDITSEVATSALQRANISTRERRHRVTTSQSGEVPTSYQASVEGIRAHIRRHVPEARQCNFYILDQNVGNPTWATKEPRPLKIVVTLSGYGHPTVNHRIQESLNSMAESLDETEFVFAPLASEYFQEDVQNSDSNGSHSRRRRKDKEKDDSHIVKTAAQPVPSAKLLAGCLSRFDQLSQEDAPTLTFLKDFSLQEAHKSPLTELIKLLENDVFIQQYGKFNQKKHNPISKAEFLVNVLQAGKYKKTGAASLQQSRMFEDKNQKTRQRFASIRTQMCEAGLDLESAAPLFETLWERVSKLTLTPYELHCKLGKSAEDNLHCFLSNNFKLLEDTVTPFIFSVGLTDKNFTLSPFVYTHSSISLADGMDGLYRQKSFEALRARSDQLLCDLEDDSELSDDESEESSTSTSETAPAASSAQFPAFGT